MKNVRASLADRFGDEPLPADVDDAIKDMQAGADKLKAAISKHQLEESKAAEEQKKVRSRAHVFGVLQRRNGSA